MTEAPKDGHRAAGACSCPQARMAAFPLLGSEAMGKGKDPARAKAKGPRLSSGRRRLGTLEVSSVGLGVQNMSRIPIETPSRPARVINIIRAAFDHGVTFFDAAEAYGPHEVERILGEGIKPFRDKVVITSKFGWDIDLETGERRPGLISRPDHIKRAVAGMLKRLQTDRITSLPAPRRSLRADRGCRRRYQGFDAARQGAALGLERNGAQHAAPRACRAARNRRPERVFDAVARAGAEVLPLCEELGIGFVPWSPLGVQFLTGWIDANTRLPKAISAASKAASRRKTFRTTAACHAAQGVGGAQAGDTGPDRAGLADGAKALDRAYTGHHQRGPYAAEYSCGECAILGDRTRRTKHIGPRH